MLPMILGIICDTEKFIQMRIWNCFRIHPGARYAMQLYFYLSDQPCKTHATNRCTKPLLFFEWSTVDDFAIGAKQRHG